MELDALVSKSSLDAELLPVERIRGAAPEGATGVKELSTSIRAVGLLVPVLVRQVAEEEYEVVDGSRRLRAAAMAGLREIPAVVISGDADLVRATANMVRGENPAAEAAALERLISRGFTVEELARIYGLTPGAVRQRLRLRKLPEDLFLALAEGRMSFRAARKLSAHPELWDEARQMLGQKERLSLEDLEVAAQGGHAALATALSMVQGQVDAKEAARRRFQQAVLEALAQGISREELRSLLEEA